MIRSISGYFQLLKTNLIVSVKLNFLFKNVANDKFGIRFSKLETSLESAIEYSTFVDFHATSLPSFWWISLMEFLNSSFSDKRTQKLKIMFRALQTWFCLVTWMSLAFCAICTFATSKILFTRTQERFLSLSIHIKSSPVSDLILPFDRNEYLGLYEQNQIEAYTNKRIGEKPPHVFAITDNAYTGLCQFE